MADVNATRNRTCRRWGGLGESYSLNTGNVRNVILKVLSTRDTLRS